MFPDAKWLDALKLPTKTKVAVALACGELLKRRDEFLAKEQAFKEAEEAEKRAGRRGR